MKKKKLASANYTAAQWQDFLDTLRVGGEVPADMWEAYQEELAYNAEMAAVDETDLPAGIPF